MHDSNGEDCKYVIYDAKHSNLFPRIEEQTTLLIATAFLYPQHGRQSMTRNNDDDDDDEDDDDEDDDDWASF
eukprot:542314-Amphidinium_carterae.2